MDRNERIGYITGMEWKMFRQLDTILGQPNTQDDYMTYMIMRTSQFLMWHDEMLESYQKDLDEAYDAGRNQQQEKFGYMAKWVRPEEYAALQDQLPPVSPEKTALIDAILEIQNRQVAALRAEFPNLTRNEQKLRAEGDALPPVDYAIYSRSEMQTYSVHTLELYLSFFRALDESGISMPRYALQYMVAAFGFPSLEAAEASYHTESET